MFKMKFTKLYASRGGDRLIDKRMYAKVVPAEWGAKIWGAWLNADLGLYAGVAHMAIDLRLTAKLRGT